MKTQNAVGARLRLARKAAGLTMAALALEVGTTQETVWRYERGRVRPSMDTLGRMARVLGVTLDWLWTGDGAPLPMTGTD